MECHLDLGGGLAGDMFIAALLDAFPDHETAVQRAIAAIMGARPVSCRLERYSDAALSGQRFLVQPRAAPRRRLPFVLPRPADHGHLPWGTLRGRLEAAPLHPATRDHALGIIGLLAEAQAQLHGVAVDSVCFHELGAWDSVADLVGAAEAIRLSRATRWSCSPAPCGTRRVTPTGAAILRYLCRPPSRVAAPGVPRILRAVGTGLGTGVLAGVSNYVRLLCFEPAADAGAEINPGLPYDTIPGIVVVPGIGVDQGLNREVELVPGSRGVGDR